MGLLTTEIEELREYKDKFLKGTLTEDKIHPLVALYSQIEKREKMLMAGLAFVLKDKSMLPLITANKLIDQAETISVVSNRETEMIDCSELGKKITREECLDYSGSHEECIGCAEKKKTNDLLLTNNDRTV